jgi:parallel beta-helix repeat protein
MTGGTNKSLLIVRDSMFIGESQGPRFGGEEGIVIFENNYSSVAKRGGAGIRLGEEVKALIRNNTLEGSNDYGIWLHGTGAQVRVENNIIRNNGVGGVFIDGPTNMDLGGGSVDVYANGMLFGPGTAAAPSAGGNVLTGNTPYDVINASDPAVEVKAELNVWDHDEVGAVEALDVQGPVDVDPLGIDLAR